MSEAEGMEFFSLMSPQGEERVSREEFKARIGAEPEELMRYEPRPLPEVWLPWAPEDVTDPQLDIRAAYVVGALEALRGELGEGPLGDDWNGIAILRRIDNTIADVREYLEVTTPGAL